MSLSDEKAIAAARAAFDALPADAQRLVDFARLEEAEAALDALKHPTVSLAGATVTGVTKKAYTGFEQVQNLTVKVGGAVLAEGTDYTVVYKDNVKIGTARFTIVGIGGYTGQKAGTFKIVKGKSTIKLAAQTKTYTGKKLKYTGKVVRTGSTGKVSFAYYSNAKCTKKVAASRVKNPGVYYVKATVAADSNFKKATSKAVKLTVRPKGTSVSKLTAAAKGFTVKWKKQGVQTTGYQVQYSLKSSFKSAKTAMVKGAKKTSAKVGKLKAKKKYFVRVRTYKKAGGKTYYSAWSKAKTVKTK